LAELFITLRPLSLKTFITASFTCRLDRVLTDDDVADTSGEMKTVSDYYAEVASEQWANISHWRW